MAANPHRGEVEVVLDGATYPLRPDFEACVAIERALGASLVSLLRKAGQTGEQGYDLSVLEAGTIIAEGIKAAGRAQGNAEWQSYRAERIAELVWREGLDKAVPAVSAFLVAAVTGGRTAGNA